MQRLINTTTYFFPFCLCKHFVDLADLRYSTPVFSIDVHLHLQQPTFLFKVLLGHSCHTVNARCLKCPVLAGCNGSYLKS